MSCKNHKAVLFLLLVCCGFIGILANNSFSSSDSILILYHLRSLEQDDLQNFLYFYKEGLVKDRIPTIVISPASKQQIEEQVSAFPSSVLYFNTKESSNCAAYSSFLDQDSVEVSSYKYFFFVDSTVRGPFIPIHLEGLIRWKDIFTSRLTDDVKLVGPIISCEEVAGVNGPYIPPSFFVTDRTGLRALREQGPLRAGAKQPCEALSQRIFEEGYTIDCLLTRYQGVDWKREESRNCNGRRSPIGDFMYDGTTVDPYELVFLPVSHVRVEAQEMSALKADKYTRWKSDEMTMSQRAVVNEQVSLPSAQKFMDILYEYARGYQCFEPVLYRSKNFDLRHLSDEDAWKHYVFHGQFEDRRPLKFKCKLIYEQFANGQIRFTKVPA